MTVIVPALLEAGGGQVVQFKPVPGSRQGSTVCQCRVAATFGQVYTSVIVSRQYCNHLNACKITKYHIHLCVLLVPNI